MKKLLFLFLLFAAACTTPQRLQTGRYTIAKIENNLVSFKEVPGQYFIACDTLQVNDTIMINVIRLHNRKKF